MMSKEGFDFCVGPLVFKGKLDDSGAIIYAQRDLGPFGSNLDDMKGRVLDDELRAQMIRDGFERVKQYTEDYRQSAAKYGVDLPERIG